MSSSRTRSPSSRACGPTSQAGTGSSWRRHSTRGFRPRPSGWFVCGWPSCGSETRPTPPSWRSSRASGASSRWSAARPTVPRPTGARSTWHSPRDSAQVRLVDLANAYAALGARGELVEPFAVQRVRDAGGRLLYERAAANARRVLSPEHAYLLADILSDADARIPGFGGITPFELPFPAAVKSGTTTGFRDDWTVGYTPDIAIGVWVGNADGSPMIDVAGVDGAGPIWRNTMMAAAIGRPMSRFARPAGIVDVTVCSPTGLLPGPDCPSPVRELFVAGTEPIAAERYYARDAEGRVSIDPPLEAREWARAAGLTLRADGASAPGAALRIVAPIAGSVFYIAPELRDEHLVIRAAAGTGVGRITFEIDGRIVGERPAAEPWLVWDLEPGQHTLRLSADGAPAVTSTFEVKP